MRRFCCISGFKSTALSPDARLTRELGSGVNVAALRSCTATTALHYGKAGNMPSIYALSYYLFRTRALLGGLKGIGWALLYFAAVMAVYFVIAIVVMTIAALAGITA